jgi:hypothetical protein
MNVIKLINIPNDKLDESNPKDKGNLIKMNAKQDKN